MVSKAFDRSINILRLVHYATHNFIPNAAGAVTEDERPMLSVCVSVCPANILVFYFSAIRRDTDLKFIHDTYRVVLNSLQKLTFIGQWSRSQGRYIAF